jgi:small membrane protein
MRIAQLFLMVIILGLLWFALHHRSSTEARAFRRIAFLGLTLLIVLAVLFPEVLTDIANTFGIGRGADLVIYLVSIGLLFFSVSAYLKFGDMDRRITLLTRHIALLESKGDMGQIDPEDLPEV